MLDNLRADTRRLKAIKPRPFPFYVLESLLFENGYQAVVMHRIAHWFKRNRVPTLGPLVARLSLFLTGVDIGPGAQIGPGLFISHGTGLVIGGFVEIGGYATLLHQVTIGATAAETIPRMPKLGDRVFVGAGAKVIGDLRLGDDVFIGADALVVGDVEDGAKVLRRPDVESRREG